MKNQKIKLYKQCGRCGARIRKGYYCLDCEEYKEKIKEMKCRKCQKKHWRTDDLDWWWRGLCRECFFNEFESHEPSQKVLNDLEKFDKNYKKLYGEC